MKEIIETELQRIKSAMSAMETEHLYYLSSKWAVLCAEKNILEKVVAASTPLTSFEQKLALLHSADIYAHGEVSGKFKDLYRTNRNDTKCLPEHGCGYHEEGSVEERNPTLHKGY